MQNEETQKELEFVEASTQDLTADFPGPSSGLLQTAVSEQFWTRRGMSEGLGFVDLAKDRSDLDGVVVGRGCARGSSGVSVGKRGARCPAGSGRAAKPACSMRNSVAG